ncbi:hypothetical protein [Vibrio diabolicus]|uniref:hypothetical protein n=1 Tax=Vibrio diabolicus TaxID=50719 RepID=UPI00293FA42B|nr:hypothetical protein [Vibrio diabolicus]MDV5047483.1 hypothetical protein [Vibrio diabolicus]
MIYEKKNYKKTDYLLNTVIFGGISVIVFVYFLHFYISFAEIVGDSAKATEIITSIAALATARAFLLAVYQYRKNSIKDRQETISSEAKNTIENMIKLSDEMANVKEVNIDSLNHFLSKMSNVGSDFDVLFKALEDDIYKAMVRMQWQNMFFNHLRPLLVSIDAKELLNSLTSSANDSSLDYIFITATEEAEKERVFKEYEKLKFVLKESALSTKLEGKINDFTQFKTYYLDDGYLNDVLYGLLSRIDIRAVCPLLAAIDDYKKRT